MYRPLLTILRRERIKWLDNFRLLLGNFGKNAKILILALNGVELLALLRGNDMLKLKLLGRDSWDRPVYECDGKLYVDVDPRAHMPPDICTKYNNAFEGEPDSPVNAEFEFIPERDVW